MEAVLSTVKLELLERRLFTMYLLAMALRESCEACTKLNLNEINRHAAYQENLCTEVRFLDREVGALEQKLAGAFKPEFPFWPSGD